MEQAIYRIEHQGFNANLEGFDTCNWSKLAAEVKGLQEVLGIFEANE